MARVAAKDVRTLLRSRTVFGKLSAKDLEEQRKALRYIELIAMQANIPINTWNIPQVFRQGASKKLITDPKEINKRIFATHANTKELDKKLALLDVYENHDKLKSCYKVPNTQYLTTYEQELAQQEQRLKELQALTNPNAYDIKYVTKNIRDYKKAIKKLKVVPEVYENVIRIVSEGFWRLLDVNVEEGNIRFITANNIVLFDKNPKTKLNLHKDMGQYICNVSTHYGDVWIEAFKGNTELDYSDSDGDGYLHPYVSGGGVCFGNAGTAFHKAKQDRDLYKIMSIVGAVLGTYNSGNGPHVTLYQFTKKSNSREELRFIKTTTAATEYYARKAKQAATVEERLKELAAVIPVPPKKIKKIAKTKKVSNVLAKSMGKAPVRLERISHDDENDEELADEIYEEETEDDDEGYF